MPVTRHRDAPALHASPVTPPAAPAHHCMTAWLYHRPSAAPSRRGCCQCPSAGSGSWRATAAAPISSRVSQKARVMSHFVTCGFGRQAAMLIYATRSCTHARTSAVHRVSCTRTAPLTQCGHKRSTLHPRTCKAASNCKLSPVVCAGVPRGSSPLPVTISQWLHSMPVPPCAHPHRRLVITMVTPACLRAHMCLNRPLAHRRRQVLGPPVAARIRDARKRAKHAHFPHTVQHTHFNTRFLPVVHTLLT